MLRFYSTFELVVKCYLHPLRQHVQKAERDRLSPAVSRRLWGNCL